MQVGIIGFGNFGKFMASNLNKKLEVFVTDVSDKSDDANNIGVKFVSLDEICKLKMLILAAPMSELEEILEKIKNKLSVDAIVLDVCSLKIFSCKAMKEILPKQVEIIGTHPLFGPQSATNSIVGMRIALVNVRAKKENFDLVNKFCEGLGLKVIITSAEEHDKQMALSQALTHFIGQACKKIGLNRVEMSTKTFDDLMSVVEVIKNDTPALFSDMQSMNPFAKDVRGSFVNSVNELNSELNSKCRRK